MTAVHIGRGCRRCAYRGWRLQSDILGFGFTVIACRYCVPSRLPRGWGWFVAALAVLAFAALCGIGAK